MCDCDLDRPEFIREKIQKALKPYRCGECRSDIKAGDKYCYIAGKWDGEFYWFRMCLDCWAIAERPDVCFAYGRLYDALKESDYLDVRRDEDGYVVKQDGHSIWYSCVAWL